MNKQDRKTADRLKSALDNIGVVAKRTQTYDLIAAARGLRNRELLKERYEMPSVVDAEGLRIVAERLDPVEAEAIAVCAAAVAMPTPLTCEIHSGWRGASFEITFDELGDPDAFLGGPRGKAGLEVIARNMYHTAYYLDRSDGGIELKRGNELAGKLLEISEHCDRYGVLEEFYGEPRDAYESVSEQTDEIEKAMQALAELANDVGAEFDEQEWTDPLRDALIEHLEEDDDSSIEDMIQSGDRAEIIFMFAPKYAYLSDAMITAEYGTSSPDSVNIDHPLQFALSRLGYGIGEFRRFSGNVKEAREGLDPTLEPLARTIVTPGELMSIMDNAGDSYFHIGLYAQIPISDVLALDAERPITLRNVRVCAHGSINGTHYDGAVIDEIVVNPEDGVLMSPGYSPSDMCGYVNSYFHGTAKNVEEPSTEDEGHLVSVCFDADQYRLAFAA